MEITARQFGLLIAYLLPGFVGLAGVAPLAPTVAAWLQADRLATAGVGPSVYAIVAATTAGLIISCFRWLLIDTLLHCTGLPRPIWKDQRLDELLEAFDYLVENHYRYYQFYANTLMAILWSYSVHRTIHSSPLLGSGTDLGATVLCAVMLAGARDALAKYYQRTSRLIGYVAEKGSRDIPMTNGNHHEEMSGGGRETRSVPKPSCKPEPKDKGKGAAKAKTANQK